MRKSYGIGEARLLRRMRRGRLLLVVAAALTVAAALFVVMRPPGSGVGAPADGDMSRGGMLAGGTEDTRWGRLSASDRTLLVKVRQAGLWEMPAGQQAQQRAASPRVKEVAAMIAEQHARLDEDTRAVAQRLEVILPSEPSQQQKGWLAEMTDRYGNSFDDTFVLRLRAAHGAVFSVIATVRAKTENSEIRAFAERAMKYVNTHMSLLESTGLVSKSALS
ncbi:hypothetical protein GCM10010191_13570 [Actinomadura vinacea]|uniref:DUF4142 domain-containing protein n=1 Tax=Actinomadura vinacea TaxID=115336 RepID=A0ABN3IM58_9ACTN